MLKERRFEIRASVLPSGQSLAYTSETKFFIQIGKRKSGYWNRHVVTGDAQEAARLYIALELPPGYKKRFYAPTLTPAIIARDYAPET